MPEASSRKPLMSGNWKMNLNHFEALKLVQELSYQVTRDDIEAVDVSLHPPFTDLRTVQTVLESDKLPFFLGAQHCYHEESGAFTGEVSPAMLAKLNISYVIVGHSERREIFGESDEMVNQKVHAINKFDMTPILCCGETLAEREEGQAESKVAEQIRSGLAGLSSDQIGAMVVAYEPIWAIGTGKTASSDDAQAMCAHVRSTVAELAGDEAAQTIRIQYGGSVKPTNVAELMSQPDIDGALVGGACLEADSFARVIQYRLAE